MQDGGQEQNPNWAIPGKEKILREDLRIDTPAKDETAIILQRHEDYVRDKSDSSVGSIKPEAARRAQDLATSVVEKLLNDLNSEDRKTVDVMIIGSPTQYYGGGKRSLETAKANLEAIRKVFVDNKLDPSQILNDQSRLSTRGEPIPSRTIVEPKMIDSSPEFVEWLKNHVGSNQMNLDFWIAFEGDKGKVKEKREEMGAEGPDELADRLNNFVYALKGFSLGYHRKHPGRRLLLWAVTHSDTITPFVKKKVNDTIEGELAGVDYSGGIGINITKTGESRMNLGERTYPITVVKS